MATCGSSASWPSAERLSGPCQPPPAGFAAAWTMKSSPSKRVQTATASPAASTASSGSFAVSPAVERSTGPCQAPPAGLVADWTMYLDPSWRRQTAIALPAASMPTSGSSASRPATERFPEGTQLPPACLTAAWTIVWAPSKRVQTATASPAGSTATCGSSASRPAAERSAGASQRGAASAGAAAKPASAQSAAANAGAWRASLRKRLSLCTCGSVWPTGCGRRRRSSRCRRT